MRIHDATEQAYKRGYEDGRADAAGPRPCLADDKPALFHRWVEEDKAMLQLGTLMKREDVERAVREFNQRGVADASSTIRVLRIFCALVEYPDGSVGRVKPELIQFLDRKEG